MYTSDTGASISPYAKHAAVAAMYALLTATNQIELESGAVGPYGLTYAVVDDAHVIPCQAPFEGHIPAPNMTDIHTLLSLAPGGTVGLCGVVCEGNLGDRIAVARLVAGLAPDGFLSARIVLIALSADGRSEDAQVFGQFETAASGGTTIAAWDALCEWQHRRVSQVESAVADLLNS
jgi:hypothetical protein